MNYVSFRKTSRLIPAIVFLFCFFLFFSCAYAESTEARLDAGRIVNSRIKTLSMVKDPKTEQLVSCLKAIRMADSLPDSFVPSEENTVSSINSAFPIYIFFDNMKNDGVMYFYTEGSRIVMNPDSSILFYGLTNLTDISALEDWDASHVTNMNAMFAGAMCLPDALAIRKWDTSSVKDMSYMFTSDISLRYIDVSCWDTGNVTSMAHMFQVGENWKGNGELTEIIGIGNLDVSNVTDMTCMFYGAGKMTQYDIAGWDVSKVESMNHMFGDNFSLRNLDLSQWDVSSVKTMYCMFDDNHALKSIGNVSHWNTASLIDAGAWLNDAIAFVGDNTGTLDLSGWDTSNLKSVGEMFLGTKIHTIDLSGWTFCAITNDPWDGAGQGIYYEYGNGFGEELQGFGQMFSTMWKLDRVYVSQSCLDSFYDAVKKGINTEGMWSGSSCDKFTVK